MHVQDTVKSCAMRSKSSGGVGHDDSGKLFCLNVAETVQGWHYVLHIVVGPTRASGTDMAALQSVLPSLYYYYCRSYPTRNCLKQ